MKLCIGILFVLLVESSAFQRPSLFLRQPTRLFLEDWVADLIDKELHREQHRKEFENEWMEKNRAAIFNQLNNGEGSSFMQDDFKENFREFQKDKRLAEKSPENYCADRCLATGNCDVYEDMFKMTPSQVIEFCTNCVLALDEEDPVECEIPEAFFDADQKLSP